MTAQGLTELPLRAGFSFKKGFAGCAGGRYTLNAETMLNPPTEITVFS